SPHDTHLLPPDFPGTGAQRGERRLLSECCGRAGGGLWSCPALPSGMSPRNPTLPWYICDCPCRPPLVRPTIAWDRSLGWFGRKIGYWFSPFAAAFLEAPGSKSHCGGADSPSSFCQEAH